MDGDGHVIGVCQVMNKLNERIFTDDDVAIIEVNIDFRFETKKLFDFSSGIRCFLWFGYS